MVEDEPRFGLPPHLEITGTEHSKRQTASIVSSYRILTLLHITKSPDLGLLMKSLFTGYHPQKDASIQDIFKSTFEDNPNVFLKHFIGSNSKRKA